MTLNEKLDALPKWIHLKEYVLTCPHCNKPYDLDKKPKVETSYLSVIYNGEWIVRYGRGSMEQFVNKDLDVAIELMRQWIEQNKEEVRPFYAKEEEI
jgi:hypothetical protein